LFFFFPFYIYHLFIQLLQYPSFNYTHSLSHQGLSCIFLTLLIQNITVILSLS
jgi:hypothetical protein